MKRSESVLVYGVTGVLGVILAIAIIFGGETSSASAGEKLSMGDEPQEGAIPFLDKDTVGDAEKDFQALLETGEDEGAPAAGGGEAAAADPVVEEPEPAPIAPIDVPLQRSVRLGLSRTEENPASGERFRFVTVKAGQSLPLVIQRWCPGTEAEVVAALNEDRNLDRLHPGDEICVPWVDDEILLAALERRAEAPPGPSTPVPVVARRDPQPASSGVTYTLKEGDSLWLIAKRRVGARKAQAYIEQILASNPSIHDASSVSAGQEITLPN